MWWHGSAGLTEQSEQKTLYAVATHDVFCALRFQVMIQKDGI